MNKHWESIAGWFDFQVIYDAAVKAAKPGSLFVEVGVCHGKSICYLGARIVESRKDIKVIGVDRFSREHTWGSNMPAGDHLDVTLDNVKKAGCDSVVTLARGDSVGYAKAIADESVDFCFIDADHSYESAKADITAWLPKVKPGGTIAGHDYTNAFPGVEKAVLEIFPKHIVQRIGASWRVTK